MDKERDGERERIEEEMQNKKEKEKRDIIWREREKECEGGGIYHQKGMEERGMDEKEKVRRHQR